MADLSLLPAIAWLVGFVQGYVSIPTLFAAGPLAQLVMRARPGMNRHRVSRFLTVGVIALGLVLLHLAFALAWLHPLAAAGQTERGGDVSELGRHWVVAVFGGMLIYAFAPAKESAPTGPPEDPTDAKRG